MRNRIVAGIFGALLALGGITACSGDDESPDGGREPAAMRLYLGGLGEMFVVDVETEQVRRLEFPALVGGDPSNLIEARGDGFVLWSGDKTRFSQFDLARPPRLIGKSLFFVTGAASDSVWLVGRPRQGAERLGPTREVDTSGNALVPASLPPGGYPATAVSAGLAFERSRSIAIWDAPSDQVVNRIPTGGGLVGATHGDLITLCDYQRGAELRMASASSGRIESVATPANVVGVDCRAGEISPDSSLLAAPVTISNRELGWRAYTKAPVALGIADLRTRRLTVIPGTRVPNHYVYVRWSPDATSAFILGRRSDGPRSGEVENRIVEFSPGSGATREIEVDLGGFYDVVVADVTGPMPPTSYAERDEVTAAGRAPERP